MTYSLTLPATTKANVHAALIDAVDLDVAQWPDGSLPHLEAAISAAARMAAAVGLADGDLTVTIGGHSNPDNAPVPGQPDEFLSVTVAVAR